MFSQIQYVNTMKQILQLNYGPISSPTFLFCCSWVKNGTNNKVTPLINEMRQVSYSQILVTCYINLMNPWFSLHKFSRCFFWNEPNTPWWKVVLGNEPRSWWVVAYTYDDNIETHGVVFGLELHWTFQI